MSSVATTQSSKTPQQQKVRRSYTCQEPNVLADIYREDANIAIWQRSLSSAMCSAAQQLLMHKSDFQEAMVVTPDNAFNSLHEPLAAYDSSGELRDDIAHLVDMFCCLFELKSAGLRLTALNHAMCPKFHVDRVPCRLVTTYQGIATEWLSHENVDRTYLGVGGAKQADETSGLIHDLQAIHQLQAGDIALLKGEAWEGNEHAGLVHRSPALPSNDARLLCTLDFVN